VADKELVLNKMTSVDHNSLKCYQHCTPHEEESLLQNTKITNHSLLKSWRTSASLELINCDDLEFFPNLEWCGDGDGDGDDGDGDGDGDGVEDECSCSFTVIKNETPSRSLEDPPMKRKQTRPLVATSPS
jgi:hypothetical protein